MADDSRWAALTAAGVLDPSAENASDRRRALQLLLELGADVDELVEHASDLGYVAARIVNGTQPTMSRRQLADRCGVPLEAVERLSLAAGMPDPGPDAMSVNERDIPMLETFAAASLIFGEQTALQLGRVVGVATARMAEAIASAYRSAVAPRAADQDQSGLAIVQSNIELSQLLPTFMVAVEQLLRRHIVTAIKPMTDNAARGYDSAILCVGFLDLVGSTALAERLTTTELSRALGEFETIACDAVVGHGGRVIKLIGDEIMFTNAEPRAATSTAQAICTALRAHPVLPSARAGLALGDVLTRDGDCFGTTVNLAARLVGTAEAGQIVLDAPTAAALTDQGLLLEQLGDRKLKGFSNPVPTFAMSPAAT